jgi:hypothetical protein
LLLTGRNNVDYKLNEHNETDSGCQMKEMQALASRGSRLGLGGSRRKQQRSESGSCSHHRAGQQHPWDLSPSEGKAFKYAAEGRGKMMHKFEHFVTTCWRCFETKKKGRVGPLAEPTTG